MSTLVGMQLNGRYRLDAQVGAGGMSTVYRAFDQTLERPVAIKLLHREIASDSAQLERFRREARAVARLSHPHVVTVIDAGEDDGRPYIVFEHVEGETLKQRIQRRARRPEISAILAAVVERATSKDLGRRYSSDDQLIADLEDSLAIETARAGAVSGEATTVLRTLPRHARRRLPLRLRHPGWLAAAAVLTVALAAGLAVEL